MLTKVPAHLRSMATATTLPLDASFEDDIAVAAHGMAENARSAVDTGIATSGNELGAFFSGFASGQQRGLGSCPCPSNLTKPREKETTIHLVPHVEQPIDDRSQFVIACVVFVDRCNDEVNLRLGSIR